MTPLAFTWPQFMSPDRLWLLAVPPLLLAAYIFLTRRKSKQGMRYTNTGILDVVVPAQSQWLRHVTVSLALLSLIALAVAWARPLGVDQVPRERATVIVVLDNSYSMEATDVAPNRLAAAKAAAIEFVNDLPDSYNIAVVSMSGSSGSRVPPTTDHALVIRTIESLTTQPSTDVGQALEQALIALEQAPKGDNGSTAPGMVVMLSDAGGTTNPDNSPRMAARELADRQVPLYAVVFGTDNGYVDIDGERYPVAPDFDFFADLTAITGGEAWAADNAGQLHDAYENIHSEVGYVEENKEITATAAGIGLAFAFVAAVGAVMMGARWR
jgi:Ca-activated chloride channel family protein